MTKNIKMDPTVEPRDDIFPTSSRGSTVGSRHKWLTRLAKVECPDTTYIGAKFPTVFKKGNGLFLTDIENKKYLDFTSCFGVLALGHRAPTTLHAIKKQSARLIHGMGDVHPTEAKIKLLELLARITPYEAPKSMLGLSGSDAIEIAMKTAVLATGRSKFISFDGGYHGVHLAPLNLNHSKKFKGGFEALLTNQTLHLPFPYFEENGPQTLYSSEMKMQQGASERRVYKREAHTQATSNDATSSFPMSISEHTVDPLLVLTMLEDNLSSNLYAALVLEPIQGRGGVRVFTKSFLQECQNLCKKYGTLLIFDEILTGFGRTGPLFAYEHSEVVPDLMCIGKAMGGGLPLSACVGDIMNVWEKSKGEARHTQTFLGHPLSCAVAYDTILHIQKKLPSFQAEILKIDKQFDAFLQKIDSHNLMQKFPCFVRGSGFMRGLWFYSQDKEFGPNLMENLYEKKFLLLPEGERNNVLSLKPPLIATAKEYQKILNCIVDLLKKFL